MDCMSLSLNKAKCNEKNHLQKWQNILTSHPPTVGTREVSHTSEWIRSKVTEVMDSLWLKGKAGCLPS